MVIMHTKMEEMEGKNISMICNTPVMKWAALYMFRIVAVFLCAEASSGGIVIVHS